MLNKTRSVRVLQLAGSLALCTMGMTAQADPISLQAVCHVTSAIPGQGKCQLDVMLSDSFLEIPATIRRGQIKVNNILVANYMNDANNPAQYSVSAVSGSIEVACNAVHSVTARIVRPLVAGWENVGALPPVQCPAAP